MIPFPIGYTKVPPFRYSDVYFCIHVIFIHLFSGYIWSRYAVDFDHWEVELIFKVTGRGRIGADGLVSQHL